MFPRGPYSLPKKSRVALAREPARIETATEEEILTLIQGKTPESVQEWRFAKALDRKKLRYRYQVQLRSSPLIRGAIILDFEVWSPFPIPCPIQGSHWHKGQIDEEDRLQFAFLRNYYGIEPVPFFEDELESIDEAVEAIEAKLP